MLLCLVKIVPGNNINTISININVLAVESSSRGYLSAVL